MKLQAHIEGDNVVIHRDSFDHLINCLANQKYIPLPMFQRPEEMDVQNIIDSTWRQSMDLLKSTGSEPDECEPEPRPSFKQALTTLINQYSKENGSDTPDFILAKYLTDTLKAFNRATNTRSVWYDEDECLEELGLDIVSQYKRYNRVEKEEFDLSNGPMASNNVTTSYPDNVKFTVTYEPK